ncbi:MAG: TonB-dependent receptor plug domain-containing protein [Flavobacteriales bacterium]
MKNTMCFIAFMFIVNLYAQTPGNRGQYINIPDSVVLIKDFVMVSGKGLPSKYDDRTSSIQLIDIVRNRDLPIRSVNEALSYVPGLDLRQRGVQGIQGDLSIRGGGFDQNLILINGFKLVDPQTGHHALNLPVLLTNVSSIEVFKGSGTRVFGQNAMTGAVNFVTSPNAKHGINAQGFGASFGGIGTQFTVNAPVKSLRQSFSAGIDKSNGYWYNSDFLNQQFFYDAVLPLGKVHEIKAIAGYTDRAFGANGYYTNFFPDQWEATQMAITGVSHQLKMTKLSLLTKASLRTHRDEFRLKRFDPSFYTNKHWSEVLTLEETAQYKSTWGVSGAGAEYRAESLESSNLGSRERTYISGFLDHKVSLFNEKLILIANAHYFKLSMNNQVHQRILPGFECAFHPVADRRIIPIKVYANIGQSYRAPTYTDLFYQDYANVGNPDLQPEYATNAELGIAWNMAWGYTGEIKSDLYKSKLSIEAAVYRRNTTNMIDWVRSTMIAPNPWTPVNLSNVIFTGFESNINYRWNGTGSIIIRELSLGYNYIDASHQFIDIVQNTESRYAFTGLRNQLIAKLTMNLTHWVYATVAYRGVDRVDGSAYSLVDAKLMINPTRNFSVFIEGNNLFNTDYIEAGYVQMPGRWFKAGVQVKFYE